jgi:predicted permease
MWTHDLRHAVRLFRHEPALTAAAILTLTLGIGANAALFTLVEAVLLRPLPYEQADRLVLIRHRDTRTGLTKPDIAMGDFVDLRARQQSFESLAGFGAFQATYFSEQEPLRVEVAVVTPDALAALRVVPALGRALREDDAREKAAGAVMVSHEFWRTQLGADAQAMSRSIQLGAARRAVAGVLPPGFRFPGMTRTDILAAQPLPAAVPAQRRNGWIYGIGRLRTGVSFAQAQNELTALSQQFERDFPQQNQGSRYEALTLRDGLVGDTRQPLLLLLAAAGFVLLIACANVGNLLLARQMGRQQELAIRRALGASRRQLVALVFTEGCALALAGAVVGLFLAWQGAPLLARMIPNASSIPALEQVTINRGVLLFSFAAAIAAAVIFSAIACVGLFRAGRGASSGSRRHTIAPGAQRAASSLVAAEIALAVVLLAGAGLTMRSFAGLLDVDPGFTSSGVLTFDLALPEGRYEREEARREFYARTFESLRQLPGVEFVGAAMVTPLTGNNWSVPLQRTDRPLPAGQRPPDVGWQLASEGYFRALRIPLLAGRFFDARDATGPEVVIISQAVAERFFAGENALGHFVSLGDTKAQIVGIVGNIRRASLTDDPRADLYFPFERVGPPTTTMFVRVTGEPLAALAAIQAGVRRFESNATVEHVTTLARIAEDSAAATRLASRLLAGCAAIALVLATIGVYAMMAYRVRRRSRELGTRLALGASRGHITRLILVHAVRIAAVGLSAGTIAAVVFATSLSSFLFNVTPWDPATLGAVAGVLALATLVASYLPARRAARVDPVSVLSAE